MLTERTSRRLEGIRKCSLNGVKVKRLYQIMTNYPDLWMLAYSQIQGNQGVITPGIDNDTLDGFSRERVEQIIEELRSGTYEPKPVRRSYIPKANGKKRPLGIPSGNDKLVQCVAKILLEQIYEPVFSDHSHGFRPGRSCHTALTKIQRTWTGVKWFIEADIKGCFDNIDHDRLIQALQKIDDRKFIKLIKKMLKAGYMEEWIYHNTYSGTPQGGIISPILANIYLHELDRWIEAKIKMFNKGEKRQGSIAYRRLTEDIHWARTKRNECRKEGKEKLAKSYQKDIKDMMEELKSVPAGEPMDPNYRRLLYCRYADDFLLGVIGSKEEAQGILDQMKEFLAKELKLAVAEDKTGIKHSTSKVQFLSYEIATYSGDKVMKVRKGNITQVKRTIRNQLKLYVPTEKIREFSEEHGIGAYDKNKSLHRPILAELSDLDILSRYSTELRGFANYYALANRVKRELNRLAWLYQDSLAKTLAFKHKTSKTKIYERYKRYEKAIGIKYESEGKKRVAKMFRLKDLKRKATWDVDSKPQGFNNHTTQLIDRLSTARCEYCEDTQGPFEVHHIRKLADIKKGTESWKRLMIAMNRKTLVLCVKCHDQLHAGTLKSKRALA